MSAAIASPIARLPGRRPPFLLLPMIESYLSFIQTRYFLGPEVEKRYFRLFGDLEYDLLSLHVEVAVMGLRIREAKRRITASVPISSQEEQQISATSHELNEHLYTRLERLHARIAAAKSFRYDQESERQGYYMLQDIALAIFGLKDGAVRARHMQVLDAAGQAYGRQNMAAMIDLHESVQGLLAYERREGMNADEESLWKSRLLRLHQSHPLRRAAILNSPEAIELHIETLKWRIDRRQRSLESLGLLYTGIIRTLRFRN